MNTIRTVLKQLAIGLALAGFASIATAQPTAHYVPGVEGIKAASLPPPGVYVRDYNVAYFSDRVNNFSGDEIPYSPEAFIYANVPRIIWITEYQVLGGYLGVDALIPLQYTSVEAEAPGRGTVFDESTFGIGDFFAEATWSAHVEKWDFSLGAGFWAPTGDFSTTDPTRAGLGYWSVMFTAGLTYYFDAEKKWALSALNRYEINMEQEDTDVTPGQAWTLEAGLSYSIKPTIDVGVVGYYQLQTTEDELNDIKFGDRDQVAAIGPEISAFCTKLGVNTSLRYLYEFYSEGRFQGHTIALTLTKRF